MSRATIHAIFDAPVEDPTPLPLDEELALIASARQGHRGAQDTLLLQYAPALRRLVSQEQARTGGKVEVDEARQNALTAFAEAIRAARPGERIVQVLREKALHVGDEFHLVGGLSVPARTARKVFAALRATGGEPSAATVRYAVDELGMAEETVLAALQAVGVYSVERIVEEYRQDAPHRYSPSSHGADDNTPDFAPVTVERGYATVDQRFEADRALAALDETTRRIVRDAYGFTDYDVVPDAEIAHRMGFSRSKVQRLRDAGLVTMHDALCNDDHGRDQRCARDERHVEGEVA